MNLPCPSSPLSTFEETLLSCPICHSLYTIPVSLTTCQHTFCSECIRKSLRESRKSTVRKSYCPVCRLDTDERNIVANRTVAGIVNGWKAMRSKRKGDDASSTSFSSSKSDAAPQNSDVSVVPPPRRRKTQTRYHGLKKKKLQVLCTAEGLSSVGTDVELRDRHLEFITLYNAECDAEVPRRQEDLVREVEERETARKKEERATGFRNKDNLHLEKLKQSRKKAGEAKESVVISSGNAKFDSKLNSGFSNLIQNYRLRNKQIDGTEGDTVSEEAKNGAPSLEIGLSNITSSNSVPVSDDPPACIPNDKPTPKHFSVASSTTNPKRKRTPSAPIIQTKRTTRQSAIMGAWVCSVCTYRNDTRKGKASTCEMCQSPRIASSSVAPMVVDC